ncbi:MAG: TetR/AcrR family transcriptional regulator [Blastocatellia bacterium]|nr:TetR/AcrR family transcriptional regulator [Blastocatellia bacterium]MBL8194326.1 TetR/AcrR family transcriptional regulator [Blastocatellia bacterium]MBN8721498.1 TetR/AcrR family transcriptional regulator [Acidobacteriota bacterium]
MGIKERRERQKEFLRQEILEAARELFVKEGYENVSMRKIAEKIEYSPTTIYIHFKDKADLLFCICEETFEKLLHGLDEVACLSDNDPVKCLEAGIRKYIYFGLTHPNDYKVAFMYRPEDLAMEDINRFLSPDSMGNQAYARLRDIVVECIKQKKFKEVDPELVTQSFWTTAHGIVSLLIIKCHFPWVDQEQLISHTISSLINNLKV